MLLHIFFSLIIAIASYILLHFLSHGPLLIYPDQFIHSKNTDIAYTYAHLPDKDKPPVPGVFVVSASFWTLVFCLPLIVHLVGFSIPEVIAPLWAGMVVGKFFFGPLSARESIRWDGPTGFFELFKQHKATFAAIYKYCMAFSAAIYKYCVAFLQESIKDVAYGYVYKLMFFIIYLTTILIPILNAPFPWVYDVAQNDKGMPWGGALCIGFVYVARWQAYLGTLWARGAASNTTTYSLKMHYLVMPSFVVVILYINLIYVAAGFALTNFQPHYLSYIGLILGAILR